MKHKQYHLKSNRSLFVLLIIAVLAATFIAIIVYRDDTAASSSSAKPDANVSKQPLFSFDTKKAPGWWQGATNDTSMAVFDKNQVHECFVSAEYKKGTVNADAEINKINTELTQSGGGYTVTALGSQAIELQTSSEPLQYELLQSSVSTPAGAEKLKGGQEFGFVQLSGGYIKIMGYCDTPEQLPNTIESLQAIRFSNTKQ
jgi:hypothetical protein